ncbi:MAG TPA: dihydrolipoamide acetyltransferase family protein [Candidatus Deferrimicrobiaceae bacterium]|nr:dihydrolipoamide acetyltransferase family protein [Candidatus Deferrimicrobiaceae bacterium]
MEFELRLPDVGEGVAEGEIVRWLVAEGAPVKEDDLLVEVLTDKAAIEIPSPVTGTLSRIVAQAGQVVNVGEVLAVLEVPEERAAPAERTPEPPPPIAPPVAPAARPDRGEVLAVPAVRKLAKDLEVDLSAVPGTGPEGRVTEEDVRKAARLRGEGVVSEAGPAPAEPRADEERIPFRGKRRMAAKKMVLSKSTIPHALLVDEADATNLLSMREALREIGAKEGVKITILPFLVQSVVAALRLHPAMNASLDESRGEIVRKKRYDIGIAVDMEDGLVVPVLRDAGEKTVVELAREIERLAEGARRGTLSRSDLSGSTFTVTSIGSIGGLFSYPVINVPEAAILGVHKVVRRPVVREGKIVPRDMMYLSLSFDHRLIDGGTATRFLNDVILRIESISLS